MQIKCKFLRVDSIKSKTGSFFHLGCFCDEGGQIFKVFLSDDVFDYLADLGSFSDVVLDLDISIYKENLSLRVADVH